VHGISAAWLTNGSGLMYVDASHGVEMMRQRGKSLDTDDLYYLLQLINIAWSPPVAQDDMDTRSRHVIDMLDVLDGWMQERPYPDPTELSSALGQDGSYEDTSKVVRTHATKADVVPCHLAMRTSAALIEYVRSYAIAEGGLTDTQLRLAIDNCEDWIYSVALCADYNKERIYMSSTELPLNRMMMLAEKKDKAKIDIGAADVVQVQSRIQNGRIMGILHIRDKATVNLNTRLYVEIMQDKRIFRDDMSSITTLDIGDVSIILSPRDYEHLTAVTERVRDNMYYGMALWMYAQEYGYL
jgi:hypothetical protein